MRTILMIISIATFLLFMLIMTIVKSEPKPIACYLCGNIAGGYVAFYLPSTKAKRTKAYFLYDCEPFKVIKCPREGIIGVIEE